MTKYKKSYYSIHSEIDAINKLKNYYDNGIKSIYILNFRFSQFQFNNSKPCNHCYRSLLQLNSKMKINKLLYSIDNKNVHIISNSDLFSLNCSHISYGNRMNNRS